jgi:hypothetical protein
MEAHQPDSHKLKEQALKQRQRRLAMVFESWFASDVDVARIVLRRFLPALMAFFRSQSEGFAKRNDTGFKSSVNKKLSRLLLGRSQDKKRDIYRDPVRSSHGHFVKASGLRWLSLMLLPEIGWAGRCWALPFLTVLAPSQRYREEHKQGHRHYKKLTDWGGQILIGA